MSLPINWIEITLNDIGQWGSGGTPKRTNPSYYDGNIPWLIIGDINDGYVSEAKTYITKEGLDNSSAKLIPANTLLIAMYGSIGKLGITEMECATNQAIAYCHTNDSLVSKKFVFYYLLSMRQTLLGEGKGGAQQNISQTVLKAFHFPLPPLNEQKRIAKKLDELLATVESIKTRLDNAPNIIKRFRQSILAAVTSGKLTEEWREENGVSEKWKNVQLKDISQDVIYGYTAKSSREVIGPQMVRITDIQDNKVNWENVPYCKIDDKQQKKYKLEKGDLLFARTGATVGKSFLIEEKDIPDAVFASYLIRVRCTQENFIKYLAYYFQSSDYWSQITEFSSGIGQPNVNGTKLKNLKIPLPRLEEQKEIVSQVESLFTLADALEAKIEAAKKRVDRLSQSILAKAFNGELVPQDPNDEPAEKLLERIKAEQEKEKAKKTRKKK